ncbi:sialidase family protein [Methylosinus sporium]|uniref:Glycosyl hydrolase n=1 Tax=Methylosinus sporium TaxID=428 RepID=A0A2U1SVM0_METSR|nr:sialidase family protein [Methylosinus sporium]PWB95660.1 glycosyl hydrolase [Methylosinus sporium]
MKRAALALLSLLAASSALAQEKEAEKGAQEKMGRMAHAAAPACADPLPRCAVSATPSFGADGRLWLTYSVAGKVYGAMSRDNGGSFAPPFVIAAPAGTLDDNGEARPKIVALADGTLLASYTTRPEKSYEGTVFVTRSTDEGRSFAPPQPLVDDKGQRFETFILGPKGRLFAAWLDKRDAARAKAAGESFEGSGIAVAWSDDAGKSFSGKSILLDHSCECCRIGAALDRDGQPVFIWRHVFENNRRDHMAAKLSADGKTLTGARVSLDDWATSCPHQGPALAIDAAGRWHIAWFTRGKTRQGLFYARSEDGGKSFSEPERIGDAERAPQRPQLLASGGALYRAWKEFDGTTTTILAQISRDGGKSFDAPRALAQTAEASDHPLLAESKGVVYLSWLTHEEGYRLIPLQRDHARAPARNATAGLAKKQRAAPTPIVSRRRAASASL